MSKSKLIIAMVAIACLSTATWADGYEGSGAKGFSPPAQVNWTGVYIGGHVGYGWADSNSSFDYGGFNDFLFNTFGLNNGFGQDMEGWIGGVHLGMQQQHGNWVIGIEGTYDAMDHDDFSSADWSFDSISCGFIGCFGLVGDGTQDLKIEIDDLFTVTARVGHTWGRLLAYVKGGYAKAEVGVNSSVGGDVRACFFLCVDGPIGFSGSSEEDHHGYTLGAGMEYMVHHGVTLGFEYDYVNLESKTHTLNGAVAICCGISFPASSQIRVDPDAIHSVNARLTFLFGPNM